MIEKRTDRSTTREDPVSDSTNPASGAGWSSRRAESGIAAALDASTYLEIGVAEGDTFRSVNVADRTGVDPKFGFDALNLVGETTSLHEVTSDLYFRTLPPDKVFDPGLHRMDFTPLCGAPAPIRWASGRPPRPHNESARRTRAKRPFTNLFTRIPHATGEYSEGQLPPLISRERFFLRVAGSFAASRGISAPPSPWGRSAVACSSTCHGSMRR